MAGTVCVNIERHKAMRDPQNVDGCSKKTFDKIN